MDPRRDNLLERVILEGYNSNMEELRKTEYPQLKGTNYTTASASMHSWYQLILSRYNVS